jgi:divalent metal cation (Fe/Co/Zn/Cd) transporter
MMDIERWGWYSIAANIILAAINLVIATVSGSLAVEAEMAEAVPVEESIR